jgi:endonuclease/exonuclease/phosphatase family metal-dependent hydrolase
MRYLLIVLVLFSACAPKSSPTGNNASITILSYNIHHANPPSKPNVIDLEAIAKAINAQQPHLVALQELDMNTKRSGATLNQAQELGRLTGMYFFFAKTIDYDGGEYGIGILSKFPLKNINHNMLPTAAGTNGEPRGMVAAEIELPNHKKIIFASTHLDAQRNDTNRLLQIHAITDILKTKKLPVIIAGDFNAEPSSRIIQHLDEYLTRTCVNGCGFTIPEKNPTKTIDFIAYRPSAKFEVIEHKVIDEPYASDHLPVKAILKLN